jgi:hypothetical protein
MKFRIEWTEEVTQHWETDVEAENEDEARELFNLGKHLNSKATCYHTSYNETSDDCIVQRDFGVEPDNPIPGSEIK